MPWIVVNIHRIMLISGVLTMTMVYAALAPDAALRSRRTPTGGLEIGSVGTA